MVDSVFEDDGASSDYVPEPVCFLILISECLLVIFWWLMDSIELEAESESRKADRRQKRPEEVDADHAQRQARFQEARQT